MYQTSFFGMGPSDFVFESQNPDLNPVYQTRTKSLLIKYHAI